jgi:hypothetical protein
MPSAFSPPPPEENSLEANALCSGSEKANMMPRSNTSGSAWPEPLIRLGNQ